LGKGGKNQAQHGDEKEPVSRYAAHLPAANGESENVYDGLPNQGTSEELSHVALPPLSAGSATLLRKTDHAASKKLWRGGKKGARMGVLRALWRNQAMAEAAGAITALAQQAGAGDPKARDGLLQALYGELRQLAGGYMRRERVDHTLQPTALVNEVYLRLFGKGNVDWQTRSHFMRGAARAMRQILIDHARGRHRAKRGGEGQRVDFRESAVVACDERPDFLLAINEALGKLEVLDPRQAEIVEMLYFVGLTQQEAAKELGLSEITVRREWRLARAWLWSEMQKEASA
jgi:RNA polymerase sigma factor (TIGR02999 family)